MDRLYEKFESMYLNCAARDYFHGRINTREARERLGRVDELRVEYLKGKHGGPYEGGTVSYREGRP